MNREEIIHQFRKKAEKLAAAKKENRFRHVIGKLKCARLLDAPGIPEYRGPVDIKDVLWAGKIEPRVLEVLPALMIRRPKFLRSYEIPEDLEKVLVGIRRGKAHEPFRGVSPERYLRWLDGRGSQLKTFRMQNEDIRLLKSLRIKLRESSDIAVLSKALIALADKEKDT
jgi:hypothetical protein